MLDLILERNARGDYLIGQFLLICKVKMLRLLIEFDVGQMIAAAVLEYHNPFS